MTSPTSGTEYIVEELAAISGVLKDDIHVSDDTVTTYVPTDQLEDAESLQDIAVAYEHSGYEPDEITQLYPDLSLGDVYRALAYYYDHIDDFRPPKSATA